MNRAALRARFRGPEAVLGRKLEVLLVDEDMALLLPLADRLRCAGLAPTIATSEVEALFDIQASRPAIVVVDAGMARRGLLAKLSPALPVVVMTTEPEVVELGLAKIEKPVEVYELLALIAKLTLEIDLVQTMSCVASEIVATL